MNSGHLMRTKLSGKNIHFPGSLECLIGKPIVNDMSRLLPLLSIGSRFLLMGILLATKAIAGLAKQGRSSG
jgi:hypothetical protein